MLIVQIQSGYIVVDSSWARILTILWFIKAINNNYENSEAYAWMVCFLNNNNINISQSPTYRSKQTDYEPNSIS